MAAKRSELKGALTRLARAMRNAGTIDNVDALILEVWRPGDGVARYRLAIKGREVGSYALGAGAMLAQLNFAAELIERQTFNPYPDDALEKAGEV